jgi:hypothetical protein
VLYFSSLPQRVIRITASTVLPKTHKAPDSYINVTVDFGNSVGMIPLNSIVEKADAYKPKQRITYKQIKEYILEKYSFKVHTAGFISANRATYPFFLFHRMKTFLKLHLVVNIKDKGTIFQL